MVHLILRTKPQKDTGTHCVKLARHRRLKTANTGRLRLTRTRIHQMQSNSSFTAITPKTEPDSPAPSPSDLESTQFQRVTPDKPCATTPSHMTSACKQEIANLWKFHQFFLNEKHIAGGQQLEMRPGAPIDWKSSRRRKRLSIRLFFKADLTGAKRGCEPRIPGSSPG